MIARMKIILKLTVEVKEIEEHVSYKGKKTKDNCKSEKTDDKRKDN